MTAEQVTTAAGHIGWVEFVTADDAATTHIAYFHEDGSVYLPEGPDVVSGETFRLAATADRFWPLVRVADRPAPQVDERAVERAALVGQALAESIPDDALDDETFDRVKSAVLAVLATPAAQPVTVTAEQVREAGRRAVTAEEAIPYDNHLTDEQMWDIVGRAALDIEVTR